METKLMLLKSRGVEDKGSTPSSGEISQLTDHLFRHEAGKLVSILTGIFGIERLQLAEDVVQESLARALRTWPYYGVPKNPVAWLTQTAKNLALDIIRREKSFQDKQSQIIALIEQQSGGSEAGDASKFDHEIKDDRLRMMFVCCQWDQPMIARDMFHFARSAAGEKITEYHLQGGVAPATARRMITPRQTGSKSSNFMTG